MSKLERGIATHLPNIHFLVNSPLVVKSPTGEPLPLLAADRPSRDGGTWTVAADGTMRTTWRLRPVAVWHDGTPVTARDFAFALRVYLDPAIDVRSRMPEALMDRIEALDERSFVIHWKQPYPWADELGDRALEPLPAHILGPVYESESTADFLAHPFWRTAAYVGTGPYRFVEREEGSYWKFQAFDRYFLGRPPIDQVVVRIIPDPNTLVANLLAGGVDVTGTVVLGQQAGATVREQWSTTGEGDVIVTPTGFRYTYFQLEPAYTQQPALQDLRVRRAIAHAIDRATLAEVMTGGSSPVADFPLAPTEALFPRAAAVATHYPYDPGRALALLADAGWARHGDQLVDAAGQRFRLDIRISAFPGSEREAALLGDFLRRLGMDTVERVPPRGADEHPPGIAQVTRPLGIPQTLLLGVSSECPAPDRPALLNRGCWRHAEFDRHYETLATALDPSARADAAVQAIQLLTADLGALGLYYTSDYIAVRRGLVGPGPRWPPQMSTTWNIHEWRWTGA